MRTNRLSFVQKVFHCESGQVLIWLPFMMLAFLAMAGLTIDVGHAYIIHSQLQNSANAAALAAAGEVYNTSSTNNATSFCNTYSGSASDQNVGANQVTVTTACNPECLNMLLATGSKCTDTPAPPNNAIQVTQTGTVPTYFMRLFGIKTVTVSAIAVSSMQGMAEPWNVAIILDATGSMNVNDPYCPQANTTSEQCAMNGIQVMLKGINPCRGVAGCGVGDTTTNFRVSLFSFPNVSTDTVANDYNCGSAPTAQEYTLPVIPASGVTSGYAPITYSQTTTGRHGQQTTTTLTSTYQITPPSVGNADVNGFMSDYYQPSGSGGLNSSSIIVKAIGNGTANGCLQPPGGLGSGGQTYFAGAIYAAQAALMAEQAKVTNLGITSNNAIILVSDGQANTGYNQYPQATSTASSTGGVGGISVTFAGNSSENLTGTASSFGVYPDYNDDCQQAITAANYAKGLGTRMYAVAYGSESNGCTSDSSVVVSGTLNLPIAKASAVIPCLVMEDIASPGATSANPWYFYTDGSSVHNGCTDTTHTSTDLSSIFGAIAATFTNPRLLPHDAK